MYCVYVIFADKEMSMSCVRSGCLLHNNSHFYSYVYIHLCLRETFSEKKTHPGISY